MNPYEAGETPDGEHVLSAAADNAR